MSNVTRTGGSEKNNATSDTHFGISSESQAQIRDSSVPVKVVGESLNVYRLEPIADINDPRWQDAVPSGPITVAARTSGDARILVSSSEVDFMEIDSAPAEDVTTANASAFRDEKLYTVIEIEHGRTDIARGVLDGLVGVNVIRPLKE